MGYPVARSQNQDAMSYPRAVTPSRNTSEDGCKVLHIATSGTHVAVAEAERGSAIVPFTLHHISRKKAYADAQCQHPGKLSAVSIPSSQRLDPGSPTESNSSSKISNLGSSSSSSPSSTSSLNETASFAVGELSPICVTGLEGQQDWYSPTRERYQRCATPSKTWDDSEMQLKSSLCKPNDTYLLAADISDIVVLDQASEAISSKTTRQHPCVDIAKHLEFDMELADAMIIHCNKGYIPHVPVRHLAEVCSAISSRSSYAHNLNPSQAPGKDKSDGKQESGSFKPSLCPALHGAAPSKRNCESTRTYSVSNSTSTRASKGYIHPLSKESNFKHKSDSGKDVGNEIHGYGLLDECYAPSKMQRGGFSPCEMKGLNQMQGSAFKSSTLPSSDAQALPICAPGCSLAPYEADIGVDTHSLQVRTKLCSPVTKAKPSRSSSSHQPSHAPEEVPHFQTPTTPEANLDVKHSADCVNTKFTTEKYASKALVLGKQKESPNVLSDQGFSDKPGANRHGTSLHSYSGTHKNGKSNLAPVLKTRVRDRQSWMLVTDGKYTEKADAFTPHAPLLHKGPIYREGPKPNPSLTLRSKSQWDWRSKSLGAKASIKSAVRSLEATFTASRSLSLPKTRSDLHKEPKFENSKLLDRVFISPMRARSKQVGILPIDRPGIKRIEIKDNGTLWRRDARAITSNLPSKYGAPRPLLPIGFNNGEIACKPFLPASTSVRRLPASGGTRSVERTDSSARKWSGFLSHPSGSLSPCISHAQLHRTFSDGVPCYTMTIEGSEEVMLAKACWLESHSSREDCNWQYSFYSGQGRSRGIGATGWRNWIKKDSKTTSDLSGVMKIFVASECESQKVLEFVLYDGRGAEVSHSQSFRFCPSDKPYIWSKGSNPSLSHSCSEDIQPLSPILPDTTIDRQHGESLADSCANSEKGTTAKRASTSHANTGCHRSSLSLDAWSDSEVADSAQSSSSFSSSQVELAAMVIQLSTEGDSNVSDSNHVGQTLQGWGAKFLNNISEREASHTLSNETAQAEKLMALERKALDQNWFSSVWPYADPKLISSGNYNRAGCRVNQMDSSVTAKEKFPTSRSIANVESQAFSGSLTLLLPRGEHSLPISGSTGPSSLIERWRSGGSCECGGWDLGCGINVITSECSKANNRKPKRSAAYDQQVNLFSQGSMPELMLGLCPVKQGEFKLSFQIQLSPLKVFAAAVAILHSHQSSFLDLSQALASSMSKKLLRPWPTTTNAPSMTSLLQSFPTSSASLQSSSPSTTAKLPLPSPTSSNALSMASLQSSSLVLSSALMSPSPLGHRMMPPNFKDRPPRPPQNYFVGPGRLDPSSKDKISPLPAHILQLN
ncbi:hypothetical protein GOP47_0025199 [Adiantum capillus-veneris]|uniref:Uncharacterized protein n=1 Tax=Adiantum capillus-veneris TaxID=13818 RepID=A0A9D4U5E1_ADICA|nr:hypothetical protein GOP47_0025199 [Adiantum capillus-veneris]